MSNRRPHQGPAGPPRPKHPIGKQMDTVHEVSAGGLVVDSLQDPREGLLISRYDRRHRIIWSFPKGHIENGETAEQAALREVHEETGVVAEVVHPLGEIDFWFTVEGRRIHKTVHHFVMVAVGGALNDSDPEVESVEWVALDDIRTRLAYSDERTLLRKSQAILKDLAR